MRILLSQGHVSPINPVKAALMGAKMSVDIAVDGEEIIDYARTYDYDLVIVELNPTNIDSLSTLLKLRADRNAAPVLILSGHASAKVRARALAAGADDCLASPYEAAELIGRVQAIVRRSRGFCLPALTAGNVVLDLASQEVSVDGTAVYLTGKEFAILELMMLRQGVVHSKEALLNHLYAGMDEPGPKIVDVFICKLRRKLAEAGAENLISTVWGRGYILRAAAAQPPLKAPGAMPIRKPATAAGGPLANAA